MAEIDVLIIIRSADHTHFNRIRDQLSYLGHRGFSMTPFDDAPLVKAANGVLDSLNRHQRYFLNTVVHQDPAPHLLVPADALQTLKDVLENGKVLESTTDI